MDEQLILSPYTKGLAKVDPSELDYTPSKVVVPKALPPQLQRPFEAVPEGEREVDWESMCAPTETWNRKFQEFGNYYYVTREFVEKRLDDGFGPGQWEFIIIPPPMVREYNYQKKDKAGKLTDEWVEVVEVAVEGVLRARGLSVNGVHGIGSGKYYPKNEQGSIANALASAETTALKNAAKRLGIARDVADKDESDEIEVAAVKETIRTLVIGLIGDGKDEKVEALFLKVAPKAWNSQKKEVYPGLLGESQLEKLQKALLEMVNE